MQSRDTLDPSASLPEREATSLDVRSALSASALGSATIENPRIDLARVARVERLVVKVGAAAVALGAIAWYLVASAS